MNTPGVISSVSDLLGSPLVAQGAELVRVCGTDLVQRGQVPGQVRPKVLCGFREVRDVLETFEQSRVDDPFNMRTKAALTVCMAGLRDRLPSDL